MAKYIKPSTADHIRFAFELYKRIPQSRKITAQELKAKLDESGLVRDIRTIQRNLDVIVQYFDVDKDTRDKPFGYSRHSNHKRTLGAREAIILGLAEQYLRDILPEELVGAIESTFTEAQIQYSPVSNGTNLIQPKKVMLARKIPHIPAAAVNSATFEKLCIAVYHNRWITIKARSLKEVDKEVIPLDVMPLGIVLNGKSLYLVYMEKGREKCCNILLCHIDDVRVSTFTFEYPNGFDLKRYSAEFVEHFISQRPCLTNKSSTSSVKPN